MEYRPHTGCTHPVHDHNSDGCLAPRCPCRTPRSALVGRLGTLRKFDGVVRVAGVWWLLTHGYEFIRWVLGW